MFLVYRYTFTSVFISAECNTSEIPKSMTILLNCSPKYQIYIWCGFGAWECWRLQRSMYVKMCSNLYQFVINKALHDMTSWELSHIGNFKLNWNPFVVEVAYWSLVDTFYIYSCKCVQSSPFIQQILFELWNKICKHYKICWF